MYLAQLLTYLLHERALDMRWQIVSEARSTELAIIIWSYIQQARQIIASIKKP